MKILIVDDHPLNLKLLRAQLEAEGHAVVEARDGLEALAKLDHQTVDAIITDILMPHMDGFRLCHEIRKRARLVGLPIIIYTSIYTSANDEKLSLDMGADKYIAKPASVEGLLAALHEVAAKPRVQPHADAMPEVELLEEYSERLVSKLEEKNSELVDSEAKFRGLVEQSLVGIYIIQDGRFSYVNPKMAEIMGLSEIELMSAPVMDFIYEEDRPLACENIRRCLAGEIESIHYELRMRYREGRVIHIEVHGGRMEHHGQPTILGTLLDITERKQAEAALQLSDFSVRQSSMPTLWVAPDAGIIRVNQAACELLGYTESELLAMSIPDLDPDFTAERWPSHWQELRQLKRMRFETRQRHQDGHIIPIEVDLHWFEFEGREYNHVFIRDLTARKAADEEIGKLHSDLEIRAASLETSVRELDAFSYSVAHDLRAPLRAVDGFSRMMLENQAAQLDGDGLRMLGVIHSEAQRMGVLIDDLLAFSRIGRQQVEPVPIDMHALARNVYDELAAQEPGRKLRLDLQVLPPARGTPKMIRQVWKNLIDNAIKFTKERDTGEIEIGAQEGRDGLPIYYVKDNGAGFDMRFENKLFGVFQRLHSAEEFPGTGVGLALVQRIVKRHGGQIWAEGEVNRGATFYFTLANQLP